MTITTRDLDSELEDIVDRMFRQHIEVYLKYNKRIKLSTASGLSDLVKHLQHTYQFTLTAVGKGSLISPRLILNSGLCLLALRDKGN